MFEVHLKGKKIAVLLAKANVIGYDGLDVTYESGDDENYVMHGEISTKYDAEPFGDADETWDGSAVDLNKYTMADLEGGNYDLCFQGYGAKGISGLLSIEIETLCRPDDDACPFCDFCHYAMGKIVENSSFKNDYFDTDAADLDEEELEECMPEFDEWHDFDF